MPHFNASGASDHLIELCNHDDTIASTLQKKQDSPVHAIWEALYPKPFVLKRLVNRFTIKHDLYHGRGDPTKEDLDRAEKCGKFPYRPSDLFLKVCLRARRRLPPNYKRADFRLITLPDVLRCIAVSGARPTLRHVCTSAYRDIWSHSFIYRLCVSSPLPLPELYPCRFTAQRAVAAMSAQRAILPASALQKWHASSRAATVSSGTLADFGSFSSRAPPTLFPHL